MRKMNILMGCILLVVMTFWSCNNEEEVISQSQNLIEVGQDNEYAIQNFINTVNGIETRSLNGNDPTQQVKMRAYASGAVDCFSANGSCLPEIIVISGYNTIWDHTQLGSELQKLVNDKKVTLRKEYNEMSNTEFYIYNGTNKINSEIVVPIAYRNE